MKSRSAMRAASRKSIFFGDKLHRFRPVTPTTTEIFLTLALSTLIADAAVR